MSNVTSPTKGYLLAAILGAITGGVGAKNQKEKLSHHD
jgi:outer membrane lipoprotein SlyB